MKREREDKVAGFLRTDLVFIDRYVLRRVEKSSERLPGDPRAAQ